jgi:hypothetical protein
MRLCTARTVPPGQDTQNRTGGKNRLNRKGRTGQAEEDKQNRTGRTGKAE